MEPLMQNEPPAIPPGAPLSRYKIAAIAVAALLVLAALSASIWFFLPKLTGLFDQQQESPVSLNGKPEGALYLSMTQVQMETDSEARPSQMYRFDFGKKKLEPLPMGVSSSVRTPNLSDDGNLMAYASVVVRGTEKSSQIFIRNLRGFSEEKQITISTTLDKGWPEWSPEGNTILFTARSAGSKGAAPVDPEQWGVYVTDLEGKEQFITNGTYPKWIDANRITVLKRSGLYLHELESGKESPIWETAPGEIVDTSMHYALASLGTGGVWIAWTDTAYDQLSIAEVVFSNPITLAKERSLSTAAFSPTFSSDGKRILFGRVDFENSTANPRLVTYDVATGETAELFDLSSYAPLVVEISDWKSQ